MPSRPPGRPRGRWMSTLRTFAVVLALGLISGTRVSPVATRGAPPGGTRQSGAALPLPMREGSLKFAVFGDFGDASKREFDTVAQVVTAHASFPSELVALTGDNLYGSERPQDFVKKFEQP